jgi:hypothetical protein
MDGKTDGQANKWTDGTINGRKERVRNVPMYERIDRLEDRHIKGHVFGWKFRQMEGQTELQADRQTNKWKRRQREG